MSSKGTILVTGGGGYIGSHTVIDLIENGYDVVSIDDHSRSFAEVSDNVRDIVKPIKPLEHVVDMKSCAQLREVFVKHPSIMGVIHFAAYKAVGESVEKPVMYYENNLLSLINLLKCCEEFGTRHIVFSSSCTVYGVPDTIPVVESTPMKAPNCPYGATKQMGEQILVDFTRRGKNTQQVCLLRYFNPAGAHPSLKVGEVPNGGVPSLTAAIVAVATGRRAGPMKVFGNDYPTRDGTCVRDFIHVCDIAHAHTLAIEYMMRTPEDVCSVFNLGKGQGNTVMEAIRAFERVSGTALDYTISERRPGDVPAIYSDSSKAYRLLEWTPKYDLDDIMLTAYAFEKGREHSFSTKHI